MQGNARREGDERGVRGTYRSQGLDGLGAFLRQHAEQEDRQVVHGRSERAGHEGHGLQKTSGSAIHGLSGERTVPTRTNLEGSKDWMKSAMIAVFCWLKLSLVA